MLEKWVPDRLDLCRSRCHLRCRCCSVCSVQYKSIGSFQVAMLQLTLPLPLPLPLGVAIPLNDITPTDKHAQPCTFKYEIYTSFNSCQEKDVSCVSRVCTYRINYFPDWYIPVLAVHCCAVTVSFIATILWVTSFCQGGVGLKVATVFLALIASKLKNLTIFLPLYLKKYAGLG